MTRVHPYRNCKDCGKSREEDLRLSATGLCLDCAEKRRAANLAQLAAKEGPYYVHWLRRCHMASMRRLVAAGALALDETQPGR